MTNTKHNQETKIEFTRINNDVNGNPRYVCHFLDLLNRDEVYTASDVSLDDKYSHALKKARAIGGKKFHNKQYGGGVVFQSYSTQQLENKIKELL